MCMNYEKLSVKKIQYENRIRSKYRISSGKRNAVICSNFLFNFLSDSLFFFFFFRPGDVLVQILDGFCIVYCCFEM